MHHSLEKMRIHEAALTRLRLDVGAGKLIVAGASNNNEVRVLATACANSSKGLEELDLTHSVRDSDMQLRTERRRSDSIFSWLSFGSGNSYIDIEVAMPSDLTLDAIDGSGPVEISNISSLSLNDGSGSIVIDGISGNVDVDDGSGSISISRISGIVSVKDGAGPIRIRDSNEVTIIDDGSGEISIENIHSNVSIRNDGSGGISIRDVAGNVEIGDAGSGSVDVRGVAGVYDSKDN